MSHKVVIDQPSPSEGKNIKRKRGHNNQQKQHVFSSYKGGVSYHKRSSSGRPGSPHRYFDTSYDVIMSDGDVGSSSDRREVDAPTISQQTNVGDNANTITSEITTELQSSNNNSGNQVVHRHLNGLCIITAGNILDRIMAQSFKQKTIDNEEEEDVRNKEEVEISTIQYHVGVGKDSQSARGKMRTKNKKQKNHKHKQQPDSTDAREDGEYFNKTGPAEVEEHDGNVLPNDTICTVTLSNGSVVQLKCCVEGTVIELNNRLLNNVVSDEGNSNNKTKQEVDNRSGDVSVLSKDPLLDGYLAVIMPSRGMFPPKP